MSEHTKVTRTPQLEFYCYEIPHTAEGDKMVADSLEGAISQLGQDDDARKLEGHNGVALDPMKQCGYTVIDVLPELWGLPWNNLIVAYLYALKPTTVRVSTGYVCLDACSGRVTVELTADRRVANISQEIAVGYGSGAAVGAVLRWAKTGYDPAQRPKPDRGLIGNTAGLERIDFQ